MTERTEFTQLDRRFYQPDSSTDQESLAFESYVSLRSDFGSFSWKDLLQEDRIIIVLAEPGSGKTAEFRYQAALAFQSGTPSFFVRLDDLVHHPFLETLSPEHLELFRSWTGGNATAYFFLDSVDEARFQKSTDFEAALRRFRHAIPNVALPRAKIFISSRISEWQPTSDTLTVATTFSRSRHLDAVGDRLQETSQSPGGVLVVNLLPLDRKRVKRFAQSYLGSGSESFIASLDEHFAWEFARRPLDVVDLIQYFKQSGKIGSLSQLIEDNVRRGMSESPDRIRYDSLPRDKAIDGAKQLGAAVILCKRFSFPILDPSNPSSINQDALSFLPPNWAQKDCADLIARPLFEPAAYGRIRFHHRRITEYLAAQWLSDRMRDGCPLQELESVLFSLPPNRRILRPSLKPVAAWLCIGDDPWNESVRKWVVEASPELHLSFGDPGLLTPSYRRELLLAVAKKFSGREAVHLETDSTSLSRIGDPVLADDLIDLILDKSIALNIRIDILQIVEFGKLVGCINAVLTLVERDEEPERLKVAAIRALGGAGDEGARFRLWNWVESQTSLPSALAARLCEALYPVPLDGAGLGALLEKVDRKQDPGSGLRWALNDHLRTNLRPEHAGKLLKALVEKYETEDRPTKSTRPDLDPSQWDWIPETLTTVLTKLFANRTLPAEMCTLAAVALHHVRKIRRYGDTDEDGPIDLQIASLSFPSVRAQYFWLEAPDWPNELLPDFASLFLLCEDTEPLSPHSSDIEWLLADINGRASLRDKELALLTAVHLWKIQGRPKEIFRKIKNCASSNTELIRRFHRVATSHRFDTVRSFWIRTYHHKLRHRWWWENRCSKIPRYFNYLRDQSHLYRNLRRVAKGELTHFLVALAREAEGDHPTREYSNISWGTLRKKRGRFVAAAAARGCVSFWRRFTPELPHQRAIQNTYDARIIPGLAGLQEEFRKGGCGVLTRSEAALAVRYAMNELNGLPSWFDELALLHEDAVCEVLTECIEGEWRTPAVQEHTCGVLYKIVGHKGNLDYLVTDVLLRTLRLGDPENPSVLRYALNILIRSEGGALEHELSDTAHSRVRQHNPDDPRFMIWMTFLFHINPTNAIAIAESIPRTIGNMDHFMENLCTSLLKEDRYWDDLKFNNPLSFNAHELRRLIPIIYQYVTPSEDIDRSSGVVFSPDARDHAQRFRDTLLPDLGKSDDPETEKYLLELLSEPALESKQDWILHLLDEWRNSRSEIIPWTARDLNLFRDSFECDPKTDLDLFRITVRRLSDIKNAVEQGEVSPRNEIRHKDPESVLRTWLAIQLREASRGLYTVPQETEIDLRKRPDLRIENPHTPSISIEIKWAHLNNPSQLVERLENQLVGQYLRDARLRYGVFLIANTQPGKTWKHSSTNLTFQQLIAFLQTRADEVAGRRDDIGDIAVVGIDFTIPSLAPPKSTQPTSDSSVNV